MPMSSIKLLQEDHGGGVEPSTVAGISAFLGKLWKMVEDPKTDDLIAWGKSGNSFVIKNQIDFAKTILPNYYKHNNIASFIRQLNMYGFHKIISTTSGALDSVDNDEIEFTHPNFVRGRPYLLEQIKRKMNNPKENIVKTESGPQFNESIKRVLIDIKHLKGKQETLSSQFCAVKQENEILWRELSLLRQKHAAQQNILNKLIRFLVTLAQPANHSVAKRRLTAPLMLKDSVRKQGPIIQESGDHVYTMKKREAKSPGPTIHEIHSSDLMNDVIIDSPDIEVSDDASSLLVESDIDQGSESNMSIGDEVSATTKPVPTALLRSDGRGQKRIQRVYLSPDQQLSSHFLITHPSAQSRRASEYLIPERTDNPYLELVHETEADNDGEYVTVLTHDDIDEVELLTDSIPTTVIGDRRHPQTQNLLTTVATERKKQPAPRRKSATRRTNVVEPSLLTSAQRQKVAKMNVRKRAEHVSRKEQTPSMMQTDDFLYPVDLQTEPLIEIQAPKPNTSAAAAETELPDFITLTGTSPNSQLRIDIPLTTEEGSKISSNAEPTNVAVSPSLLMSPGNHVGPMSPAGSIHSVHSVPPISPLVNPVTPISPLSPLSPPSTNAVSPNAALNQHSLSPAMAAGQPVSPQKTPEENVFMNQMNECIDNAQNMKIACTADANQSPSRPYSSEIFKNQLDCMQTEINSLKELMQNEGLTLDVNNLLNQLLTEDPMDYNMPTSSAENTYKPNDGKIMGNEVMTTTPTFDFNDIFSNDWNDPSTPLNAFDPDYYSLNTPQIERSAEEASLAFAPPNKKIKSTEETKQE